MELAVASGSSTFRNIVAKGKARQHVGHVFNYHYYGPSPAPSPRPFVDGLGVEDRSERSLTVPNDIPLLGTDQGKQLLPSQICTHFLQRRTYSTALFEFFDASESPKRLVLWGTGGVGKTQLALEYAHSRAASSSVFWIHSDQFTSFSRDYGQILQLIGPDPSSHGRGLTDVEMLTLACNALRKYHRPLLVLDNADRLDDFVGRGSSSIDLTKFLPDNADILITTRDPRFIGSVVSASCGIKVVAMDDSEARTLLKSSIPAHLATTANEDAISELLDNLGNLPLAVAQAAANVRELQISLLQYNTSYRNKRDRNELMHEPVGDQGRQQQSILVTWELSFEYLETNYPDSAYCINAMSLFHFTNLPIGLLTRLARFKEKSAIRMQNIIKRLLHLSLVDDATDTEQMAVYSLHPLVHERVLERFSHRDETAFKHSLGDAIDVMADLFPRVEADTKKGKKGSSYDLARYLIPHALHQIDLITEFGFLYKRAAMLILNVSRYYLVIGLTKAAVGLCRQARDIARQLCDPTDISQLYFQREYARCLLENADYAEAKEECLACLAFLESLGEQEQIDEKTILSERLDVLVVMIHILLGLGDNAEYVARTREQIKLATDTGLDGRAIRIYRHNLTIGLTNQRLLNEARILNEELLQEVDQDPEWKASHMTFYTFLLNVKAKIIRFEMEGKGFDQDLQIRRQVFEYSIEKEGPESIDTWKAVNNLLDALRQSPALLHINEAIDAATRILSDAMSSEVIMQGRLLETFQRFVGLVLAQDMGSSVQQSRSLSQKFEILQQLLQSFLDAQDLDIGHVIGQRPAIANVFAVVLQWQGYLAEAEAWHRYALELLRDKASNPVDLEEVIHYNIMLAIAKQTGRLEEAFEYRRGHQDMITRSEATHGDLETRLSQFRTENELHGEAKARIGRGWANADSEWYRQHCAELGKAQRRLGWLEIPIEDEPLLLSDSAQLSQSTVEHQELTQLQLRKKPRKLEIRSCKPAKENAAEGG